MKVVIVGDKIKSLLREKYLGKGFSPHYMTTIGADFALTEMTIRETNIKFQIWDLADTFKSIRAVYLHDALAGVVVIDAFKPFSIDRVKKWLDYVQKGSKDEVPIIIACIQKELSKGKKACYSEKEVLALENFDSTISVPLIKYIHVDMNNSREFFDIFEYIGEMYFDLIEYKTHA